MKRGPNQVVYAGRAAPSSLTVGACFSPAIWIRAWSATTGAWNRKRSKYPSFSPDEQPGDGLPAYSRPEFPPLAGVGQLAFAPRERDESWTTPT